MVTAVVIMYLVAGIVAARFAVSSGRMEKSDEATDVTITVLFWPVLLMIICVITVGRLIGVLLLWLTKIGNRK